MTTAADSKVSVDALLADAIAKMDGLSKRMDALEVGEKKIIKGDDDDDDDRKSDASAKSKADDDDDDRRGDGSSNTKSDEGRSPKTHILSDAKAASAVDAAKPPRKVDDDGELEIKHGKTDSSRKADEFPPKKKEEKCDDDDDKKSDASAKKSDDDDDDDDDDKKSDATTKADDIGDLRRQIADQQSVIARLEALMKPKSDDEHAAFADAQAKADAVFNGFGKRAPRPLEGEGLIDYRKRLATTLKMHSPVWKNAKLSKLDNDTFGIAESAIYADATSAAANPLDLEAGELRAVTKVNQTTGGRETVFYGKESFVKSMGRPGRRVASFRTMQSV